MMSKTSTIPKFSIILWIFTGLILLFSLFLWIGYPFMYKAIVYSEMKLKQYEDTQLSRTTFLWSKPPADVFVDFYLFNVTNSDGVMYYGEKPALVEIGPFSFSEIENKKYYKFSDDGSKVWYKDYKTYHFLPEKSCDICLYDSGISMINLIGQGAYEEIANPKFGVPEQIQNLIAFGFLLVGETPFLTLKAGEILFEGYNDPLLDLGHSEVFKVANDLLNGIFDRFAIPDMKKMAFYYGYNNTNDEEYWVKTGTKNDDKTGTIVSWANLTELPHDWYTTEQCRMINGTNAGSFAPTNLKKTDRLRFFMSFLCRSFYLEYADEVEINDIKTYEFQAPPPVFDTTLEENRGMRYPNNEKVNYAKGWPNCPPKNQSTENCVNMMVDCSAKENLCHSCCDGSYINGTYLMPPGLYPLQCYPGRLKQPPFLVQISPPHFVYSPSEISQNLIGMHPQLPKHVPFSYNYEPFSGTAVGTKARFMISMPIFNISRFAGPAQLPQTMLPFAWTTIQANLHQNILDYAKLGFTTVPRIVFITKIVTLALAFVLALFSIFPIYRLRKK